MKTAWLNIYQQACKRKTQNQQAIKTLCLSLIGLCADLPVLRNVRILRLILIDRFSDVRWKAWYTVLSELLEAVCDDRIYFWGVSAYLVTQTCANIEGLWEAWFRCTCKGKDKDESYLAGSHAALERARYTFILAFATKVPGDNGFRVIKCLFNIQNRE